MSSIAIDSITNRAGTGGPSMPLGSVSGPWTTATRPASPTIGLSGFNSTLGADETWDGTTWVQDVPSVLSVVATTSGTVFDVTGIPAWVKRFDVVFNGVSLAGTDSIIVQIGNSGGVVTAGYLSTSGGTDGTGVATIGSTGGFILYMNNAARAASGVMSVYRCGTSWVASHSVFVATNTFSAGGGRVTDANPLTTIRVTRTGSNTFDAGEFNVVLYRGA